METPKSPVRVHRLLSRNIKSGSQIPCWTASTRRSRIEAPRVDYEKLSGDRVGESSECIRARVQAARNIQQARFTKPASLFSNNGASTDIVCNADMRVGEIRQHCKLAEEGQSLMRAATLCCA
jgi:predicted ATPase with chaperone activity